MADDGCGMDEAGLKDGLLSSSKTSKAANQEVHYGMGSTTALPFLSSTTLSFSKKNGIMTCGMLSTTYSHHIRSSTLVVPQVSWKADGTSRDRPQLLADHSHDPEKRPIPPHPLTREQREESLRQILDYTPFKVEAELLEQFDRIVDAEGRPSEHGTLHVCFACDASKWDLEHADDDICLRQALNDVDVVGTRDDGIGAWRPRHAYSLRALLEVLYYADDETPGPLKIVLRGKEVPLRNWDTFLHEWPSGQPAYSYTPTGLPAGLRGASVRFGMCVSIRELMDTFSSKSTSKQNRTQLNATELRARKLELEGYSGIFYYNHHRLIIPLEPTHKQRGPRGAVMLTTEKRIVMYGQGLIGVCREGWLMPAHNKSGYSNEESKPSAFAAGGVMRPNAPEGRRVEFKDLAAVIDKKLQEHLKAVILPKYHAALGERNATDGSRSAAAVKPTGSSSAAAPAAGLAGRKRKGAPTTTTNKAALIQEGDRMVSRKPGCANVVGHVIDVGSGWFALRLPGGQQSENHRANQLEHTSFRDDQVPNGFERVPHAAFEGTIAKVRWATQDGGTDHFPCVLRRAPLPGWFTAEYFDGDREKLLLTVRRADGAYLGFRADGEQIEQQDLQLEASAIADAVDALLAAAGEARGDGGQRPWLPQRSNGGNEVLSADGARRDISGAGSGGGSGGCGAGCREHATYAPSMAAANGAVRMGPGGAGSMPKATAAGGIGSRGNDATDGLRTSAHSRRASFPPPKAPAASRRIQLSRTHLEGAHEGEAEARSLSALNSAQTGAGARQLAEAEELTQLRRLVVRLETAVGGGKGNSRAASGVLVSTDGQVGAVAALESFVLEAEAKWSSRLPLSGLPAGMAGVRELLAQARLDGEGYTYAEQLEELGFDDADFLLEGGELKISSTMEEIRRHTQMKPGHVMKLREVLRQRAAQLQTAAADAGAGAGAEEEGLAGIEELD